MKTLMFINFSCAVAFSLIFNLLRRNNAFLMRRADKTLRKVAERIIFDLLIAKNRSFSVFPTAQYRFVNFLINLMFLARSAEGYGPAPPAPP